jgi:hypothetical protein
MTQARCTKHERMLSAFRRATARSAQRLLDKGARDVVRADKKIAALVNEDRKRAAAQPAAILEVRAAYNLQCKTYEAEKLGG